MADINRRRFLNGILGALTGAAGSAVIASTATAKQADRAAAPQPGDIQDRAEQIAKAAGTGEDEETVPVSFLNGAFRNGGGFGGGGFRNVAVGGGGFGGGGFRNGGFVNGGGGGFRNGGFANGFGGGFRNGAFRNW